MKYVYILKSSCSRHHYVGMTGDVDRRLQDHNSGKVPHTSKFKPWQLETYIAFTDPQKAVDLNAI